MPIKAEPKEHYYEAIIQTLADNIKHSEQRNMQKSEELHSKEILERKKDSIINELTERVQSEMQTRISLQSKQEYHVKQI